jgi:hypothetical protein
VTQKQVVTALLEREGRTFADEAGITLADRPAPLYQLLVLATLLSARISAGVSVAAGRELFAAGLRTPKAMRDSSWHERLEALARGHYRRSGGRTATMLADGAELCQQRWRDDLRRLRQHADADVERLRASLTEFPGIGPVGADIFVREVQGQWPEFSPFADAKVTAGAEVLNLPKAAGKLGSLVPMADMPRLASALVRVSADGAVARQIRSAAA